MQTAKLLSVQLRPVQHPLAGVQVCPLEGQVAALQEPLMHASPEQQSALEVQMLPETWQAVIVHCRPPSVPGTHGVELQH